MLQWSFGFISKIARSSTLLSAALVVSSLNMLIQIMFSMMFGDKSVIKIGGKR